MVVKDYADIGVMTPIKAFSKKLAEKGQEYAKLHKPFDTTCARLEFRDKLEREEKESERRNGFVKIEEINIDPGNLDKYGNADRFELLEDQEDIQDKVIEGSRTQVVIGHTLSYKCKLRGHGLSVFIPIAEYNKSKEENKSKKEDKEE